MRTLLIALTALFAVGVAGCWVPVQISSPSDNTVYVLDHRMGLSPEGRVMRCSGTACEKIYQPR
jgi:hypothetical protein